MIEAGPLRRRIAALGFRREGVELDEVEALDRLRLAVFENLEVVRREPFDDLAVLEGIRVHADEVRAAAEHRPLLRLRRRRLLTGRRLRLARFARHGDRREQHREAQTSRSHVT